MGLRYHMADREALTDRGGEMVQIGGRARRCGSAGRERTSAAQRAAFDEAGKLIGTVTGGGAVPDADGVQIGVAWPRGEILDFSGVRIGHL
jgi:hypothetical protein